MIFCFAKQRYQQDYYNINKQATSIYPKPPNHLAEYQAQRNAIEKIGQNSEEEERRLYQQRMRYIIAQVVDNYQSFLKGITAEYLAEHRDEWRRRLQNMSPEEKANAREMAGAFKTTVQLEAIEEMRKQGYSEDQIEVKVIQSTKVDKEKVMEIAEKENTKRQKLGKPLMNEQETKNFTKERVEDANAIRGMYLMEKIETQGQSLQQSPSTVKNANSTKSKSNVKNIIKDRNRNESHTDRAKREKEEAKLTTRETVL